MKTLFILLCGLIFTNAISGQASGTLGKTTVMTLGVFHFAYHNLDVVKTEKKNQITVLEEPYQSEILNIVKAIEKYNPTIIAVEMPPEKQQRIDSLFLLYKSDKLVLGNDEIDQLGLRLGKNLKLNRIYCVNDYGRHYENIIEIFSDSSRSARFEDYFYRSRDTTYQKTQTGDKISSIIDELYELNSPDFIKKDLAVYLSNPFKYEEEQGDFTGVDFETGRWFNRNLRIFRNIQRIPHSADDRILVIFGAGHLNLLNMFFDISEEFEFVSPLPCLEAAKNK